jgi:hypothetical protein
VLNLFVALGGMWLFVAGAAAVVPKRFGFSFRQTIVLLNLLVLAGVALLWTTLARAFGSDMAVWFFAIWLVFTTSAGAVLPWFDRVVEAWQDEE